VILAKILILSPIIGFLINLILGKKLGKTSGIIGTVAVFISFICAILMFRKVAAEGAYEVPLFTWMHISTLHIGFSLWIDQLSTWMMLIITGIGTLIHLYSIGYMSHDKGIGRFFAYLNLFIFSMLMLVVGGNFIMLFIGWEGVGLCSYLLIGFWFKNVEYGHAARKAFIMNRIGDLGLLIGIFLCIQNFGTINFNEINSIAAADLALKATGQSGLYQPYIYTAITLCLFIGAMGKSAQIPLYTWLPDAMAGPTPVSALIHAATMVTAGIYLVVRNAALFEMAPFTLNFILIIGMATSILGALIGLFQNDIKKVLAYSTVSQLGLMFVALGVGAYTSAMFHLTTHAFFKALLFLGAGSVIHAMSGEQNILSMGGLRKKIKLTHLTFAIGTLAIIGAPLMSGFFSKDEILEKLYNHSPIVWGFGLASAMITIIYMVRVYTLTFWGNFRGTKEQESHLHESPSSMTLPLIILAILSIFGGIFNLPHLIGGGSSQKMAHWLSQIDSLKAIPAHISHLSHNTEKLLMLIATAVVIILGLFAFLKFKKQPSDELTQPRLGFSLWGENKFYVDELYHNIFVKPLESLADFCFYYIEHYFIQPIVFGGTKLFYGAGQLLRIAQNGNIEYYLVYISIAAVILLTTIMFVF
jgi:NADH-quinone oxidoreductase subunit L